MTGYCLLDEHSNCPDSSQDSQVCSCPCHLETDKGTDQDHVVCNWCAWQGGIPIGSEVCPKCEKSGFLAWQEQTGKE